mmetsp:Transcript_2980/g.4055  ORF Transcript_2980/g.4055 Transcript_2980/m.4055 type:complete len:430 (-) Transcript_2980:196-1485(-)
MHSNTPLSAGTPGATKRPSARFPLQNSSITHLFTHLSTKHSFTKKSLRESVPRRLRGSDRGRDRVCLFMYHSLAWHWRSSHVLVRCSFLPSRFLVIVNNFCSLLGRGGLVNVLLLIIPVAALALFPAPASFRAIGLAVNAVAVLLPVVPVAFVLAAVLPGIDTESVLAVIQVVAFVLAAVFPSIDALSVHIIVAPLAVIFATVGPDVKADTVDFVFKPLAVVAAAVVPDVATASVLHTLLVTALVAGAVRPGLHTSAVLQVVLPVALVLGAVHVHVDAVAVGLVIFPLAFVNISVCVPELSSAIGLVVAPLALVLGVVGPDLDAGPVTHAVLQVATVDGPVFEDELFNELQALLFGLNLQVCEHGVVGEEELRGAGQPLRSLAVLQPAIAIVAVSLGVRSEPLLFAARNKHAIPVRISPHRQTDRCSKR